MRRDDAAATMGSMVIVRAVSPDEWEILRDVRLAALLDAPAAFGSTYAREAAFTREQWRERISPRSVTFLAYRPAIPEPAGLVGVYVPDEIPELVSMWVRPSARGSQVGETLIAAAADWSTAREHDALFLWVSEPNAPARRLYEKCGFAPTGQRGPIPRDPALIKLRLRRPLGSGLRREPVGPAARRW